MQQLTSRQQQILQFINDYIAEHGLPPSRLEITEALRLRSANAVQGHLERLARKGFIELLPGRSRNIQLTYKAQPQVQGLPLVGRVAAGSPILAEQNIEAHFSCEGMFRQKPDYLLRVHGMSMRDAGILNGDLLAVRRTPTARNGEIVVARIEDEVTVKRFQQSGQIVHLLPENPDFTPLEIDLAQQALAIEGVYVGLIRDTN